MKAVVISDDRSEWMKQEDKHYLCRTFCSQYRRCATKAGIDCKKFGGKVIPKIRG